MNHLNYLWVLIGTNSGQLQTLLAVIGLILAVIAALYAKKQIKLSQDQRLFELKLSILSLAYECKDLIIAIKDKNSDLKNEFSTFLALQDQTLNDHMEGSDCTYNEYFDEPINLLGTSEEIANTLIKELSSENSEPSLQELETYLKHLISSKGRIYTAHNGFLRRIEELKLINKAFSQLRYPHN